MAKGSQLTQLKSALSEAGLSRKCQGKVTSGKKRKRSGSTPLLEKDKDKATKKIREIHERLNQFDVKVTKLKHDVGGRKLKGVTGKPGRSKQAGIEQRKKTLLVEYQQKNHAGGIVDRRFGENDPSMTPEERMLERFTRERQRTSKRAAFNLEDEDELTHYGQRLSSMDDFDGVGLGEEGDDEENNGQIDSKTVGGSHFGGFENEEESDDEGHIRKKSKAEAMSEVIAKSKEHKYQRQMEKEEDENTRHQLDQDFDSIRGLLLDDLRAATTGSNSVPLGSRPLPVDTTQINSRGDHEYDEFVRELAFDKRARPKDRTKTEKELALEEKDALEKAEKARLRRMMGFDDESDGDGEGDRKSRKRNCERGGDDLEDDCAEGVPLGGLGVGLGDDAGTEDGGEHDGDESTEGASLTGDESPDLDGPEEQASEDGEMTPLVSSRPVLNEVKQSAKQRGLPFTFPCPETHDEFLSVVEDIDDEDVPTVIQRIRSLHHPSLSEDNPAKLQTFTSILIDYVVHITSPPIPRFSLLGLLLPHLYALTNAYPVVAAQTFVAKLFLMHKNLIRGLSNGATSMDSKTWPGPAELGILRVIGVLWSTSDLNHAVVSPARVLMGAYLGLCRIRSTADLASGLFLCTLFLQFEELSKRLVPEVVNFLLNVVLHLAPHPYHDAESVPGSFPLPDWVCAAYDSLRLKGMGLQRLEVSQPNLLPILHGLDTPQIKVNLLHTAFQLLQKFADMYKGFDGFIELYTPVEDLLKSLDFERLPEILQAKRLSVQDFVSKLLKFSNQSRRPLLLQAHKPIPIPSYVPKFNTTSSNYLRKQDPDHERAEASKLRHQVKQERKGAIRELRKDSRFLAGVQQLRQVEQDSGYKVRMKKVFSSIEEERAGQKALDREKAREKKRAGRK